MPNSWDAWFKELVEIGPQAFTTWLLGGAEYAEFLPSELPSRNTRADVLLRTKLSGQEVLLHIEFQSTADSTMAQRLLEYNVLADRLYDKPVRSCVIYLEKASSEAVSPYRRTLPNGERIYEFHFDTIELERLDSEKLLQSRQPTLLALLPLTKGGKDRAVVEQMLSALKADHHPKLLTLGMLIAAAMYKGNASELAWLQRRYNELFDQDLSDNIIYQSIVAEGIEQGIEKGIDKGRSETVDQLFLPMIQARFPELTALARERANAIHDMHSLLQLTLKLTGAQTVSEARAILEAPNESI